MRLNLKIILLVITVSFGVGGGSAIISSQLLQRSIEKELKSKALILCQTTAEQITPYVMGGESVKVYETLMAKKKRNPLLEYAYVMNFNANILAHTFKNGFPAAFIGNIHSEIFDPGRVKLVHYKTPDGISFADYSYPLIEGLPAHLHIGINTDYIATETATLRTKIFLMTLVIIMIGVIIGIMVSRRITQQLSHFVDAINTYGKGDTNKTIIPQKNSFEIKELTEAFSRMIDQRKKTEQDRERLLLAIDQSNETVVITDDKAVIQYVNPAFTKNTGYSKEEVIGQNPSILKSGKQNKEFYENMWATLCNGESWEGRFINKKKDGSIFTEDVKISPVRNSEGEIINYVAVKHDISQEILVEEERLGLETQLRQKYKMEAVGVMAGGIAHNFNNNLSIILGSIELSKMKMPPNPVIEKYLSNAKIAALRSSDLVKKILTFSRQDIKSKNTIQLSLIIEETLTLLHSTIPTTINLQQRISSDNQALMINADSSQIQECLVNLCNNAMHAMEEEGDLTIALNSVELQKHDIPALYECQPGRYAKLSVQDTGSGMSAETIDKIFDLFFTTKPVDQGTGVGLSTVQGIVTQHGGMIKVKSHLGEGTTFELYFPVVEKSQLATITTTNKDIPGGTGHILFVDDDPMLANIGEQMLTIKGYTVSTMTDSVNALKLFAANADRFDLVITDQTMPGLTGKQLIQEVKKIKPEIPSIICTGYSSKIDEEKAAKLGASTFLMKPLDMPILLQTVKRMLDGEKDK